MNILIISRKVSPHIGGVEKHINEISKVLTKKGNKIKIISEADIKYPHIKLLGLFYIWVWFWKKRNLIKQAEIIHIHDVFIWYLPFRFLYPTKKIFITIHGLEWDNPLSKISILQKRLASKLTTKTIGIGKFLEKYTRIKFDLVSYGASSTIRTTEVKFKKTFIFVGRLEENTGLTRFLKWLKEHKSEYSKVDFCGDGVLRAECEKYGTVHGFTDPTPFLKKAEYCVPGGYLAALEGLAYNCKLNLYWNNKVKEDYWKMSPFYRLKGNKLEEWAKAQTWEKLANEYINLYKFLDGHDK